MKLNKYSSYCLNDFCKGCEYCVKGEKLVLFISGKCSRACWYCSLSDKRKNTEKIWANEREIITKEELIEEAVESDATSAGITGGDPLLFMDRTIEFASALKKKFGEKFHIHIYLPTKLVDEEKLERLSKVIDEVRFHPEFIISPGSENFDEEKIKIAAKFWKKENIGIEMPMIPDFKDKIHDFILRIQEDIGFVNLNEFESSETNLDIVEKKYKIDDKEGYVIANSLIEGERLLNELNREHVKLKVHLCSAELKNWHQYRNRLIRHNILPHGKRMEDGTVEYLIIDGRTEKIDDAKKLLKNYYFDAKKNRLLLTEKEAEKMKMRGWKVERVEEYPTYDADEVERWEV